MMINIIKKTPPQRKKRLSRNGIDIFWVSWIIWKKRAECIHCWKRGSFFQSMWWCFEHSLPTIKAIFLCRHKIIPCTHSFVIFFISINTFHANTFKISLLHRKQQKKNYYMKHLQHNTFIVLWWLSSELWMLWNIMMVCKCSNTKIYLIQRVEFQMESMFL